MSPLPARCNVPKDGNQKEEGLGRVREHACGGRPVEEAARSHQEPKEAPAGGEAQEQGRDGQGRVRQRRHTEGSESAEAGEGAQGAAGQGQGATAAPVVCERSPHQATTPLAVIANLPDQDDASEAGGGR